MIETKGFGHVILRVEAASFFPFIQSIPGSLSPSAVRSFKRCDADNAHIQHLT